MLLQEELAIDRNFDEIQNSKIDIFKTFLALSFIIHNGMHINLQLATTYMNSKHLRSESQKATLESGNEISLHWKSDLFLNDYPADHCLSRIILRSPGIFCGFTLRNNIFFLFFIRNKLVVKYMSISFNHKHSAYQNALKLPWKISRMIFRNTILAIASHT